MPAEWEPHRGTWLSWPHKEASWPGKFGPVPGIFAAMVRDARRPRGGAHQRGRPRMEAVGPHACSPTQGADAGNVFFHSQPHQRRLVPRPRPDLPRSATERRPPRAGDRGLGLQRLGRQVPALRPRRRRAHPHRRGARACRSSTPGSSWRAARSTSTAAARCSPPRPACSTPTAIPSSTAATIERYLRDYLGVSQDPLAGRRHRGRRHRRPRGRPHPLRGRADRRHRGRGRSGRRKLRAAPGQPGAAPTA